MGNDVRAIPAVALAACFAAAGAGAAPLPIAPGAYDVTVETVLPHLEENLRYATTRQTRCIGAQDATTLFPLLHHEAFAGCMLTGGRSHGDDLEYDLTCRNPQAATGTARVSAGRDALHAVLDVKMGGKNMTLSQRISAPRVGACE
jgi:hypothetical protein